jgi:pimeloyl-ACP methyl ester carboxylesterase
MEARAGLLRVGGTDLHWTELGEGRPLVLLHGLCDSHLTWSRIAPRLAAGRRVLMLDLPGHGLSGRPDASYALDWHARTVAEWLDALGLDEIDLVGHSYGGGVAQWLVLLRHDRIRRLALVAAGGLGREVSPELRAAALTGALNHSDPVLGIGTHVGFYAAGGDFDAREMAQLRWMNGKPGTGRAFARTVDDVIDWRGQKRGLLDRVHEVAALPPTALFWGDRDRVIPVKHGIETARVMEGASLVRYSGVGHFPHRVRAEHMARSLGAFIDADTLPRPFVRRWLAVPAEVRRVNWFTRAMRAIGRTVARAFSSSRRAARQNASPGALVVAEAGAASATASATTSESRPDPAQSHERQRAGHSRPAQPAAAAPEAAAPAELQPT